MTSPPKSHSITVTVSYESKLSPRASPDSRGGDNTRATLGGLVYRWKEHPWQLAPFLPENFHFYVIGQNCVTDSFFNQSPARTMDLVGLIVTFRDVSP